MLERISKDPFENKEWVSDKVKRIHLSKDLLPADLMRDDGMTQIPVNMDGKCNGSQHWSAIMGGLSHYLQTYCPQKNHKIVSICSQQNYRVLQT